MSLPFEKLQATRGVLAELEAERERQHAKWGEQNIPDGTSRALWAEDARLARKAMDEAMAVGMQSFLGIAHEEVLEAFCETDPVALRAELVQAAAVLVQWIEAIDRRGSR